MVALQCIEGVALEYSCCIGEIKERKKSNNKNAGSETLLNIYLMLINDYKVKHSSFQGTQVGGSIYIFPLGVHVYSRGGNNTIHNHKISVQKRSTFYA